VRDAAKGRAAFRHFAGFAGVNNLATLRAHADLLEGDVLVAFADVLVAPGPLHRLATCESDAALLVDPGTRRAGTMRVRHTETSVLDVGPHIPPEAGTGTFVGIARLGPAGCAAVAAALPGLNDGDYWTAGLRPPLELDAVTVARGEWLEVDTPEDYAAAQTASFYLTS
jgi:choline kinase